MKETILRFIRVLVGQVIGAVLAMWGNVEIPIIGMTIGAAVSALFKYLRQQFPDNKILEWLPI